MLPKPIHLTYLLILIITILPSTSTQCDTTICQCQNSTCVSCLATDFYYNSTQLACKLCPPQCRTCNPKQQCLTCRDMFYLSAASCLSCPKYCKTCVGQVCSQCINGYILINSVCQKCQIPNIETCQSLLTVKTCLSGYWKNGDSCSPCREFCEFCTSSNNCLKCQAGYRAKVSAGTYCVSCDTGCRTCSDTACTQCFWNYRLINGTCTSIKPNCSLISNCQSCQFSNNTVKCLLCSYPYYIASNGTCVKGSSILCKYSNSPNPYQCLNQCSSLGYLSGTVLVYTTKNINQVICLPKLWIQNSVVEQVSFNALYSSRYTGIFTPLLPSFQICGSQYISSNIYSSLANTIKFTTIFQPYYKLTIYIKFLPIFKSIFPNTMGLSISTRMSDNATNNYTLQQDFNASLLQSCQQQYLTVSSRNIKDQSVTIQFSHYLNQSSYNNSSQLQTMFPNGIVGYRQLLVQVYRCDSRCRICSNAKYCLQCYGSLFLSSNKCVANCDGLFQFYLPNGDYINYRSKYCVQECSSGYYSTIHPLKNDTYICLRCPDRCRTCKSITECLSCNSPYLLFSSNFSCITACPNTHYSSVATLECLPCNAPCRTCQNQTQCLSCSIGYFDGSSCVGSCPIGTYNSDSLKQCLSCDTKCSSCQNTPTFCISCKQPYNLLGTSCLTSCPQSTHYTFNFTCLPCKSPCTLCSSESQCITCSRGYLLNKTCLTDCPTGYYKDVGNSRCNLCENSCLTCLSLSICKSCVTGTYLYNSMCLQSCPLKTYTSPSNVCIPCIPPCLTCFNESSCLTCSLGYLSQVSKFTCVNQCEDGYFGQSSNQTCMKCSAQCKTCNQQQNFCLTCNVGLLLQNNACVQSCSVNYFNFNNEKCRPCSYPCKTCVDISSKCLTCQDPFILSGQNKCSLQCLSTQYRKNGTCLPCQYPCSSCTDVTTCTSCAINATNQTYLLNGNCFNYCPSSMYSDALTLKCKPCVFPCFTCQNSRQCLSCVSGYLNVVKKTCEVCSSSYFPDEVTKTCKLCSSVLANCQQCQSSTVCKVCDSGYLLINAICVSEAACKNSSGYFINSQLKRCSQCVPPCNDCLNSTFCLSCQNGYLYQGKCLFSCPPGFYANQTVKSCLSCNSSICKTCANSPNECTSCLQTTVYSVFLVQNKTCITQLQCPNEYYLDNLYRYWRCLKCIPPCKTCSNASYCLSCTSGVLFEGSCSFSCPNKYFANSTGIVGLASCQQCSSSCLECSLSQGNCISCPVTKLLQDSQCVDACSSRYYLNQYILQCLKCQSPCLQCETATYCKSCQDSTKILYYGQCIDSCPQGTYVSNKSCISCPSTCQICSFSQQTLSPICQKCSQSLYMNSTSYGKCQTSCYLTEYPDIQTRKCYPCQVPCKQCSTATKCKTCINGYLIYKSQCYKGDLCMPGTFMTINEKSCLDQCDAPYYGDNLTRLCSLQCTYNRLKVPLQSNRVCAQQCPLNYFVNTNHTCSQCLQNNCTDLLDYEIFAKSIFNKLYVKIKFSKQVLTNLIDQTSVKIFVTDLQVLSQGRRLLVENNTSTEEYAFNVTERTTRAVWLQLNTYKTLRKISIKVHFLSYYLLSATPALPSPQTNLKSLNQSILVSRFDQYTAQQQQSGKSFEIYSTFLSFVLFGIILFSLAGNFLSLFYHLIDYFQVLFMLLFLQIDYSPSLNYFLYGFRYSHYLFFPQIFRSQKVKEYSQTPGKFGIIVPDADFLSNTGHDFLIIFVCIGMVVVVKLVDFLLSGSIKNNKVTNDPNADRIQHQPSIINQISQGSVNKQTSYHQQQEQQQQSKHTHNIIQLQILQGKHGRIPKYIKIFISRLKWNYFNDISYCIYFYIALFSYSQTYILSEASFMSNLFAFIGFGFTLALPLFYIYLLNKNRLVIEQQGLQHKVYLPFKTFYYCLYPDSSYTLYTVPIRYLKKLLIAILLVYCSQFPQFVLGIIMMLSLLNIILTYLYKPYLLTFEVYVQMVIEMLFVSVIFCLCLMQLEYLDFDTGKKLMISKVVVLLTIVMTAVLIVWNGVRFVVEVVKQFCGKDYFQSYYKQLCKGTQSSHQSTKRSSSHQKHSDMHSNNNEPHEQSNVRLHDNNYMSSKHNDDMSSFSENQNRRSETQQSGLDIYLKKYNDAPPMLIKCIKNFSDKDQQEEQQEESESDSQSDNRRDDVMIGGRQEATETILFEKKKQRKRFDDGSEKQSLSQSQQKQSEQEEQHQPNHNEDLPQIKPITKLPNSNDAQSPSNQSPQKQSHSSQNEQYTPENVQQIFYDQPNRPPKKMKTIMQIQDFDVEESQNHINHGSVNNNRDSLESEQKEKEKQQQQDEHENKSQEKQKQKKQSNLNRDEKEDSLVRQVKIQSFNAQDQIDSQQN